MYQHAPALLVHDKIFLYSIKLVIYIFSININVINFFIFILLTGTIRENMMNLLKDSKAKKVDSKRRKDEFVAELRDDDDYEGFMDEETAMEQATRDSLQSQREWH